MGKNTPLTNNSGRRTKSESGMMLDGPLAGTVASIRPRKMTCPISLFSLSRKRSRRQYIHFFWMFRRLTRKSAAQKPARIARFRATGICAVLFTAPCSTSAP